MNRPLGTEAVRRSFCPEHSQESGVVASDAEVVLVKQTRYRTKLL